MRIHIREADKSNFNEIDLVIGRAMEAVLETIPEFNSDPKLAREVFPDFTYEKTKGLILGSDSSDRHHRILVASDEHDELIGHSVFSIKTDADNLAYGSFFSHYLTPEHRRFGIASRLLASAEEWMMGLGSKYAKAQTHIKNIKAQNLFRKCGYQVTGSLIGRWPYYELKKNW